ncbi:MAG: SH3 domain-containing protein [Alphaproteobacteria bacterium]|nr:SH3 domain-containing protein [Alphaproteobacteria bacterium]
MTNILGGAAITVASSAAVEAQNNITTPVQQGSQLERVQLYDLPNVVLPNFFAPPEDIYRNPGNRTARSAPYDSVGPVDERRAVTLGEREYDSVVQMETPFGLCTATISNIGGFESREQGTIITTAAHCLDITDSNHNIIGQVEPEDITFKGSYLDNSGRLQEFTLRGDEAWQNPLYKENIAADQELLRETGYTDVILEGDTAVVFSKDVLPDGVKPARILTADFETATQLRDSVWEAHDNGIEVPVTVVGHSADKPYLTTHENAKVTFGDYDGINTESDIVPGASGGPVFVSKGENQPIALTENGEPMVLAVNSTVTDKTDFSRHAYFDENALQTVPFLKPEGTSSDEICVQTGEVTASSLNIRVGPGIEFQKLAREPGQDDSALPMGSKVSIYGETRNELGQEWGLVATSEGRTGYVSMNSDYINRGPEVCAPTIKF